MPDSPQALLDRALDRLAQALAPLPLADLQWVGVHTGGYWLAQHLVARLGAAAEVAALDVSFHRDDFSAVGLRAGAQPSTLPAGLDGADVLLVDDVLQTGRTVRAALDELFDYGRPARVRLAVLLDRGGRELPVAPDFVGHRLELPADRQVKLLGPDPLQLVIGDATP